MKTKTLIARDKFGRQIASVQMKRSWRYSEYQEKRIYGHLVVGGYGFDFGNFLFFPDFAKLEGGCNGLLAGIWEAL